MAGKWDDRSAIEQKLVELKAIIGSGDGRSVRSPQEKFYHYLLTLIMKFGMKQDNPIVDLLGHTGNYWRSGILLLLRHGAHRPAQISKIFLTLNSSRPISQRMLNLNLKMLERDGLLQRIIVNDNQKHVEYKLTEIGGILSDNIWSLIKLIDCHSDEVVAAKIRFDTLKGAGPQEAELNASDVSGIPTCSES
jgi:DNA-binding HxlR family transcriptional regulator